MNIDVNDIIVENGDLEWGWIFDARWEDGVFDRRAASERAKRERWP